MNHFFNELFCFVFFVHTYERLISTNYIRGQNLARQQDCSTSRTGSLSVHHREALIY